jgi:hypothetical protein
MVMIRTKLNSLLALATLLLAAAPGFANSISLANFSFETLPVGGLPIPCSGAGCSYSVDPIPGWSIAGGGGQFQPGPTPNQYFNSLSDGPTHAYSSGGTISQTIGGTVQLGVVYTFQVDIGYRLDSGFAGTADLLINGNTYTATGVQPVQGTFGTFTATYTGLLADVGQAITLELQSSGGQGNFDNVRLDGESMLTAMRDRDRPTALAHGETTLHRL